MGSTIQYGFQSKHYAKWSKKIQEVPGQQCRFWSWEWIVVQFGSLHRWSGWICKFYNQSVTRKVRPPKTNMEPPQNLVVWVHVSPFPFGWNTFRFQLFVHSFFKIVTRWAPMIVINEVMTPISRIVRGPINPFIVGTGPPCSHWSHEAMVSCKVIRQEKLYLSERHLSLEARSIKIQQQRQWQPCELSTHWVLGGTNREGSRSWSLGKAPWSVETRANLFLGSFLWESAAGKTDLCHV